MKASPVEVVAAVIRQSGMVFISSRKNMGWEFPGGKIEPGESPAEALRRELAEELDIHDAAILDKIFEITHAYPDKTVRLHFFRTLLPAGTVITPKEGQSFQWVKPEALASCGLLPADRPLAEFLAAY